MLLAGYAKPGVRHSVRVEDVNFGLFGPAMEDHTKKSLDDFDAVLNDWVATDMPLPDGLVWTVLIGNVSRDRKGRWADGATVRSSPLVTPLEDLAPGVVARTENSRYLLGVPLGGGWVH